jgi:tRNA-modifying protein YgfZ
MRTATLDSARLHRLVRQAVQVRTAPAVFEVTGPGALTCLQGLLTNDLAAPGENSLVFGALLTPKGAIIVDYWVLRLADRFLLIAEPAGRDASLELFRRSLPPRLARVTDRSGEIEVLWLYGSDTGSTLEGAGFRIPDLGKVLDQDNVQLARPQVQAPFRGMVTGSSAALEGVKDRLSRAGAGEGTTEDRAAAGVLAGWPLLGAEIEERTLVQEVRFDDLGGVSYTKGCYTGQETVARLHFRGHTNRELKGLMWERGVRPEEDGVTDHEGRQLGTVTSLLALPERTVGLGLLRRTVEPGTPVIAGGQPATAVALPFEAGGW